MGSVSFEQDQRGRLATSRLPTATGSPHAGVECVGLDITRRAVARIN
jgi:hypothetical protein